jgi:hypothetical protein
MTTLSPEEFDIACRDLSAKIAKLYDDVEDPTMVLCALIPLCAQSLLNTAFVAQVPTIDVVRTFSQDVASCTAKMQTFMELLRKQQGPVQ